MVWLVVLSNHILVRHTTRDNLVAQSDGLHTITSSTDNCQANIPRTDFVILRRIVLQVSVSSCMGFARSCAGTKLTTGTTSSLAAAAKGAKPPKVSQTSTKRRRYMDLPTPPYTLQCTAARLMGIFFSEAPYPWRPVILIPLRVLHYVLVCIDFQ